MGLTDYSIVGIDLPPFFQTIAIRHTDGVFSKPSRTAILRDHDIFFTALSSVQHVKDSIFWTDANGL